MSLIKSNQMKDLKNETLWNLKEILTFYGIKGLKSFQFSYLIQMILCWKLIKYSYLHHPAQETAFYTFTTYKMNRK